jgi:TPP-dependent trihydroxycyclohexane-1,2-dione (THcHDO) dehydratase
VRLGVDTVFGLPGDGINGFMEALRKRRDAIRYVHVRHEEVGAMAAVAYAKFTGRSASASRRPARARCTWPTDCWTPTSTARRSWPSPG